MSVLDKRVGGSHSQRVSQSAGLRGALDDADAAAAVPHNLVVFELEDQPELFIATVDRRERGDLAAVAGRLNRKSIAELATQFGHGVSDAELGPRSDIGVLDVDPFDKSVDNPQLEAVRAVGRCHPIALTVSRGQLDPLGRCSNGGVFWGHTKEDSVDADGGYLGRISKRCCQ